MNKFRTLLCLGYIFGTLWNNVQSFSPDYYGGFNGMDLEDDNTPEDLREQRTRDVLEAKDGLGNEINVGNKRFKLYEKKNLNYEKAKAFCKKREGKLAQATNVEEMQRLQTLIMKAKTVSTGLWIDSDKREWKKHSSKMLGLQPDLGPNAHMIRGGGPTSMCPTLSLSTRSLTPNPCYQTLPFICEFIKGKGPKKKNSTRTKRKDEMRKKREIVQLEEDEVSTYFSSSSLSPLDEEVEKEERFIPESGIIIDDNDHLVLDEMIPSGIDDDEHDFNATQAHNVGFLPHIIAAKVDEKDSSTSTYANRSYFYPSITTIFPPAGEEYPSPRMVVKVSANYTVEDSPDLQSDLDVVERVDNDLGQENGNGAPTTAQTITEKHPDQQMVDLFDEQTENMKISDLLEENFTASTSTESPKPTDYTMNITSHNAISENPILYTMNATESYYSFNSTENDAAGTEQPDNNATISTNNKTMAQADDLVTTLPEEEMIMNTTNMTEMYENEDSYFQNFTQTENSTITDTSSEDPKSKSDTELVTEPENEAESVSVTPITPKIPNSRKRLLVRVSESGESFGPGSSPDPEPADEANANPIPEIHIDELPLLNKLVAG